MSNEHLLDDFRKPWLKIRVEDICIDNELCFKGDYDRINSSTKVETTPGTYYYDFLPDDSYSIDSSMSTYIVNISCRVGDNVRGNWVLEFWLTSSGGVLTDSATGDQVNIKKLYANNDSIVSINVDYLNDPLKPQLKLYHGAGEPSTVTWAWSVIKAQF